MKMLYLSIQLVEGGLDAGLKFQTFWDFIKKIDVYFFWGWVFNGLGSFQPVFMEAIWSSICQISKQRILKGTSFGVLGDFNVISFFNPRTKGAKNMQGVDVLAPQRRRKAAPLSFVKETLLCGLEGRKLKWRERTWQEASKCRLLQFSPLCPLI